MKRNEPTESHHPIDCPCEEAKYWHDAWAGKQGGRAEDAAEEVDLNKYKFCPDCDPAVPKKGKVY